MGKIEQVKLPLKVKYKGGKVSEFLLPEKEPLGVIVGDFMVFVNGGTEKMCLSRAKAYCASFKFKGRKANLGLISFWSGLVKGGDVFKFNETMCLLGKRPLIPGEEYWWEPERKAICSCWSFYTVFKGSSAFIDRYYVAEGDMLFVKVYPVVRVA